MSGKEILEGISSKVNFPMFLSIISEISKESEQLSSQLLEAFEILDEDRVGSIKMCTLEESFPGISDQVLIASLIC